MESLGAAFQKLLPSELSEPSKLSGLPRLQLVKLETRAMACQFSCLWSAVDRHHTGIVSDSLELIHELEDKLSIYRAHTEVSLLNRDGYTNKIPVSEEVYCLLKEAIELSELTDGAFNPVSRALTLLWRDARSEGILPEQSQIDDALLHSHPRDVLFDDNDQSIQFLTPQLSFDLGAIGKGYALDRAGTLLKGNGLTSFIFHGGQSSLLVGDPAPGTRGWTLSLKHPLNFDEQLGTFVVHNQAIAVSGAAVQYHEFDGVRYGHVIDPRTGWPSTGVLNSLVVAPTSAQADALATALFVGGLETAQLCQRRLPGVKFILVTPEMPGSTKNFKILVSGLDPDDFNWEVDEKSVVFLDEAIPLT